MDNARFARALGRRITSSEQFDRAWEHSRVRMVLQQFNLLQEAESKLKRAGDGLMRFSDFDQYYPTFPAVLGTARVPRLAEDPRMRFTALMLSFSGSPAAKAYKAFVENFDPGREAGVVLNCQGLAGGLLVVSASVLPLARKAVVKNKKRVEFSYMVVRGTGRGGLCVTSFSSFLARLEWSPR